MENRSSAEKTAASAMKPLLDAIRAARRPAFFTGAGVSTLCGIPDFRGPDGVYRDPDAARMFEIDLFDRDPSFFYGHADALVYGNAGTRPGPVHEALVALQRAGKCAGVVTQNIDGLHERAGSSPVFAVHGSAALHHCRRCGDEKTFDEIRALRAAQRGGGLPAAAQRGGGLPAAAQRGGGLPAAAQGGGGLPAAAQRGGGLPAAVCVPRCPKCGGVYKPDITFFGEALPEEAFRGAMALAARCDLMVVLGSSLVVQPAASIPLAALRSGARLAIVNRGETPLDPFAFFRASDLAAFAAAVLRPAPPQPGLSAN